MFLFVMVEILPVEIGRHGSTSFRAPVSPSSGASPSQRAVEVVQRGSQVLNASAGVLSHWAAVIVILYLMLGSVVLAVAEGWDAVDSLYFCVTILTTVGFGDFAPQTNVAKAFCCVYAVCGVTLVSASLGAALGRIQAEVAADKVLGKAALNSITSAASAAGLMSAVVVFGAAFVHVFERWSVLDSLYWAIITCTSVGFGDFALSKDSRKFGLVYLLLAVLTFATAASRLARVFFTLHSDSLAYAPICALDGDSDITSAVIGIDGEIDRYKFLSHLLVSTGKITEQEITRIDDMLASFNSDNGFFLDADGGEHSFQATTSMFDDGLEMPAQTTTRYGSTMSMPQSINRLLTTVAVQGESFDAAGIYTAIRTSMPAYSKLRLDRLIYNAYTKPLVEKLESEWSEEALWNDPRTGRPPNVSKNIDVLLCPPMSKRAASILSDDD